MDIKVFKINHHEIYFLITSLAIALSLHGQGFRQDTEKAQIEKTVKLLIDAWSEGDGNKFASPFTEDADFMVWFGLHLTGKKEIVSGQDFLFKDFYSNTVWNLKVTKIKFIGEEVVRSFPEAMTSDLIKTYTNNSGEFDMRLFFDKLSIHELTHNFQNPTNQEGYSMSSWLEELHANMGLYAFYKSKRPNELKYINTFVGFTLENPPPNMEYYSLADFDAHYYEMEPENYGFYQMKFTKAAKMIIDSLGNDVLRPLNDFIIKYDETWKDKMTKEDFRKRLASEVDPYLAGLTETWY